MNLFRLFIYKINQRRVINYTNDLCYHMNQVFYYILSSNKSMQDGAIIAEAVGLLDTWKMMSANVFMHIKSSTSIEIKQNSKLLDITKKIIYIELDYVIKNLSELEIDNLKKEACIFAEEYFESNKIMVSSGDPL